MNATEHGTAVAINGQAVFLAGRSGTGKSDLALRLIDRGATLIADDRVTVAPDLILSGPESLAGKLEIRGLGIVALPFCNNAALRLLVELGEEGERAPPSWPVADFYGWSVPVMRIDGFSASAPVRIEHALHAIIASGLLPTPLSATRGHD